MRNQEKVEHKEQKQRDELFNEIWPMALTKQVCRPKQKENTDASTLAMVTPSPPKKDDATLLHRPCHLKHPRGSPGLGGPRTTVLCTSAGLLDYEDT